MIPYRNIEWGIEISHPANWKGVEPNETETAQTGEVVRFVPPGEGNALASSASVSVYSYSASEADLSKVLDYAIDLYEDDDSGYEDVDVLEQSTGEEKLGQYPAYDLTISTDVDGINYKNRDMGAVVGGTQYDVSYSAQEDRFDKYMSVVEQMTNSFKLIQPPSSGQSESSPKDIVLNNGTKIDFETCMTNFEIEESKLKYCFPSDTSSNLNSSELSNKSSPDQTITFQNGTTILISKCINDLMSIEDDEMDSEDREEHEKWVMEFCTSWNMK